MVKGIEADARRWPEHGEIPPTHDELVKIKQDKERQNLLARINELEQILNSERTVGRQKMEQAKRRVEKLEQALENLGVVLCDKEYTIGDAEKICEINIKERQKMLDELAEDYEKNFHFAEPSADYIRNWKPKEERYASR